MLFQDAENVNRFLASKEKYISSRLIDHRRSSMRMYVTLGLSNARDMQLAAPLRDGTSPYLFTVYSEVKPFLHTQTMLHRGNAPCLFDRYDRHKHFFFVVKKNTLFSTSINLKQSLNAGYINKLHSLI